MFNAVLEILAATPEKLRREVTGMPASEMRRRPAPGKWSVQEILAHLDDVEELGMRARVAAILEGNEPTLAPFDQEKRAVEQRYDRRNPQKSLESFLRRRRSNLKWLRTLKPSELRRKGVHQTVGEVTAAEMIHEWAFHDLGHLKQIMEVRRYALWPHMGNMQKFYKLS
ncbi:MAG TPA: DinB family protein [Terriglobia bacterium]|nr:DinB family protein [Terriglobia bacterium]